MKKILTAVVGALVVVGAGAGLWIALDSSKSLPSNFKTLLKP